MNDVDPSQIIIHSLTKGGAECKPEGNSIIVATWKTTVWRIFIDSSIDSKNPAANNKAGILRYTAMKNKQEAVIARVLPDGHIEYRKIEDGKIIHPRCLVKVKRIQLYKKEFYVQNRDRKYYPGQRVKQNFV